VQSVVRYLCIVVLEIPSRSASHSHLSGNTSYRQYILFTCSLFYGTELCMGYTNLR
jgi:hypothetical protein